jgi:uncharacterized protein YggE
VDEVIVVRGTGQARAWPDRAVVRIVVEADAAGRDDAYREAARLAGQVDSSSPIARLPSTGQSPHRW